MENGPLDSADQPTLLTQPPLQELPDDLLRHIFHRLPTNPSALGFVSMAHKEWRRLVHDKENFLRYFRREHHSVPPLLGLICDADHGDLHFKSTPTTGNAVNLMLPTLAHEGGFHAYGCTHGRVLLYSPWVPSHHGELMVWDPLTGEQNLIPPAAGFLDGQSYGAALVYDADHAHGGYCHSSPFRIVFAYSQYDSCRRWGPPPIHVFARVYSSKTGSWDGRVAAIMDPEFHFGCKPSAVAGNATAVYWMSQAETKVVEFHLETQKLLLIDTPEVTRGLHFFLAPARDGRLRLAGAIDNFIVLFSWDEGAWVSHTLVWLGDFLRLHVYAQHENDGEELLDVAEYSDDEDEEELLYATIKSPVIGFSEQLDCIFLQEQGVFMISLESGQHQQVFEPGQHFSGPVYPYSTFYTAGMYVLTLH